jgi:hypothetical protein
MGQSSGLGFLEMMINYEQNVKKNKHYKIRTAGSDADLGH